MKNKLLFKKGWYYHKNDYATSKSDQYLIFLHQDIYENSKFCEEDIKCRIKICGFSIYNISNVDFSNFKITHRGWVVGKSYSKVSRVFKSNLKKNWLPLEGSFKAKVENYLTTIAEQHHEHLGANKDKNVNDFFPLLCNNTGMLWSKYGLFYKGGATIHYKFKKKK